MTGLAIAPQGIIGFTAGAFGARLTSRVGIRRVLVLTSAAATAGFLVLTRLPASGGYSPLLAAVMLVGFGSAGTAFGTMVTASHGVADGDQGLVGGVINTAGRSARPSVRRCCPLSPWRPPRGRAAGAGGDRAAMLAGALAAALAWPSRCGPPGVCGRTCATADRPAVAAGAGQLGQPARRGPSRSAARRGSSEPGARPLQLDVAGHAGDRPAADPDTAAGVGADVHPAEPS